MAWRACFCCRNCPYNTRFLRLDASYDVALCGCGWVVNPKVDLRPLEPRCPACQQQLSGEAFFLRACPGPLYLCPRCHEQELCLAMLEPSHHQAIWPDSGERVQVRTISPQVACLGGSLWPIQGAPQALEWVEATVVGTERSPAGQLVYQGSLAPWLEARQQFLEVEVPPLRLRVPMAPLVKEIESAGWTRFAALVEPPLLPRSRDELSQCLCVHLWILELVEPYFARLPTKGEAHLGGWRPAEWLRIDQALVVCDDNGTILQRLELPGRPPQDHAEGAEVTENGEIETLLSEAGCCWSRASRRRP